MHVELSDVKRRPIGIRDAAMVNDFCPIEGDAAEANAFEDRLSALEGRAAAAFTVLIDRHQWPLPPRERAAVVAWAAAQHLRTVAARQANDGLIEMAVRT